MIDDVIEQIGQWSITNFGEKQKPEWGMAEEAGELAHCLLKRFQGIRGFDNDELFINKLADAIADCGIYGANFCYNKKVFLNDVHLIDLIGLDTDSLLDGLLFYISCLIGNVTASSLRSNVRMFYSYLNEIGKRHKLPPVFVLMQRVFEHTVAKRDWKATPHSADANFPDLNFYAEIFGTEPI